MILILSRSVEHLVLHSSSEIYISVEKKRILYRILAEVSGPIWTNGESGIAFP